GGVGLAMGVTVFGVVGETRFLAHGYMRTSVAITLLAIALRFGLVLALIPRFGLLGAAVGAAVGIVTEQALSAAYAMRRMRVSAWGDFVPQVWRSVAATLVMAWVLWAAGLGWRDTGVGLLVPAV